MSAGFVCIVGTKGEMKRLVMTAQTRDSPVYLTGHQGWLPTEGSLVTSFEKIGKDLGAQKVQRIPGKGVEGTDMEACSSFLGPATYSAGME